MTKYKYDPDLPYVVPYGVGEIARFSERTVAVRFSHEYTSHTVIDTTPKPRVPEDALWIAYPAYGPGKHETWELLLASRQDDLWFPGGSEEAVPLKDLPCVTPDTEFTVLDERKPDDQ